MKSKRRHCCLPICIVLAVVWLTASPATATAAAPGQGPLGGPQIATLTALSGDIRLARAAATANRLQVSDRSAGLGLANGDIVQTLRGRAEIRFNDSSVVKLFEGTVVVVQERFPAADSCNARSASSSARCGSTFNK
jgi:hypothetical protein